MVTIEIDVQQKMDVDVHLSDIVYGINELPMPRRWNYVAELLNKINVDTDELTKEQKELVKKYLTTKLNAIK